MKKLISIFAALALVGSLAAQKKKPAAKAPAAPAAPAAPVVKAPAAPVVAAPAMPSAEMAGKGMGLFVDVRGSYTLSNGSSTAAADGTTATTVAADAVSYKTSASSAIGGGISIGYNIAKGLGLVASYDIRSFKTREYAGRVYDYFDLSNPSAFSGAGGNTQEAGAAGVSGFTTTGTAQQKWTNQVIGLGLRPQVNAFGGEFYGGAGVAIVLPFETTQTLTLTSPGALWNGASGNATEGKVVKGYNMAIGAYGEVGYKYFFTDNIGIDFGIRALVATADNKDKTRVQTTNGNGTGTAVTLNKTTTYTDSASFTDQQTAGTVAAGQTNKKPFETLGITDFSATVGLTLKF